MPSKKITSWAMSCFREWRSVRNRNCANEDKPQWSEYPLENPDIQELNYWISRSKQKGEPYSLPLPSEDNLLDACGITKVHACLPRLLALQSFPCFCEIRGTYDTVYRDLRSRGIGTKVCHTPVTTPEEDTVSVMVMCTEAGIGKKTKHCSEKIIHAEDNRPHVYRGFAYMQMGSTEQQKAVSSVNHKLFV